MRLWKQGETVIIKCEGRTVRGKVTLASSNGRSLALEFEAILAGHAGLMPVLWDDETRQFRSLIGAVPLVLK